MFFYSSTSLEVQVQNYNQKYFGVYQWGAVFDYLYHVTGAL